MVPCPSLSRSLAPSWAQAYRKLALRLHPDKNGAPGADDAFKAVGLAYATLSDATKKAHYDQYGDDEPGAGGGGGNPFGGGGMRHRRGGGGFHGGGVDPEDIFQAFFGGGGVRFGGQQPRYRQQQQQQARGGGGGQRGGQEAAPDMASLVQILPFLMLFLLSFFNGMPGNSAPPPFALQPHGTYHVSMHTRDGLRGIRAGIPYFVQVGSRLPGDSSDCARLCAPGCHAALSAAPVPL